MMYRLFKYILPGLAIFALLIYLGGNTNLYENFTINFLTRLSQCDIKNPAKDFVDLMNWFERLSVAQAKVFQPNDIFDFFSNYWSMFLSYLTLPFEVVVSLCKVFYDVIYNIIQILRVIVGVTGVDNFNPDNTNSLFIMVARLV